MRTPSAVMLTNSLSYVPGFVNGLMLLCKSVVGRVKCVILLLLKTTENGCCIFFS